MFTNLFINLKVKITEREGDSNKTEIFHPLVDSLKSQCFRAGPGWVSDEGWNTCTPICCFSQGIDRELNRKWSRLHKECQHSKWCPYRLYHHADPTYLYFLSSYFMFYKIMTAYFFYVVLSAFLHQCLGGYWLLQVLSFIAIFVLKILSLFDFWHSLLHIAL